MYQLDTSGLLIEIEGLDGGGSSTLAANLAQRIRAAGYKVHLTKEPTNNLVGGLIRAGLTNVWEPSNRTLQLLFAADRAHHLEREILPILRQGIHVITDRYLLSNLAFGIGMEIGELMGYNSAFPWADIVIVLQVAAAETQRRMTTTRYELELFESLSRQEQIAERYAYICELFSGSLTQLDGTVPPEELASQAFELFSNHSLITTGRRVRMPEWPRPISFDPAHVRHGWEKKE